MYKDRYRLERDCVYHVNLEAEHNDSCTFFQNDNDALVLYDNMLRNHLLQKKAEGNFSQNKST